MRQQRQLPGTLIFKSGDSRTLSFMASLWRLGKRNVITFDDDSDLAALLEERPELRMSAIAAYSVLQFMQAHEQRYVCCLNHVTGKTGWQPAEYKPPSWVDFFVRVQAWREVDFQDGGEAGLIPPSGLEQAIRSKHVLSKKGERTRSMTTSSGPAGRNHQKARPDEDGGNEQRL